MTEWYKSVFSGHAYDISELPELFSAKDQLALLFHVEVNSFVRLNCTWRGGGFHSLVPKCDEVVLDPLQKNSPKG